MKKIASKAFVGCIVLGFVLNIIIEVLNRAEPLAVFEHMIEAPVYFLFNWLFVSATLSFAFFFKRKIFALVFICQLWLALAFLNAYVLTYRVTPLSAIDFLILQISWKFIGTYLNIFRLIILIIAIISLAFLFVLIFRKFPKTEVDFKLAVTQFLFLGIITSILLFVGNSMSENHLSDMKASTEKYGFIYCFLRGSVERGIPEPENYSVSIVENEVAPLVDLPNKNPAIKPNVIMLQLESFFDINLLLDTEFSESPLPFYTYMKNNFSRGRLAVPSVGAGTANVEFEIISEMNLDFFGSGEYPYKTVLKDETCETAPFDFLELGYNTFAVHSNNATFYDRNEVFPRLGFETFISSEYMHATEKTDGGWLKDKYLTGQIMKCLESTENQDYIYTITVQGHGAYPNSKMENPPIKLTKSSMDEELSNQIEYYANQLKETDDFLMELTDALSELDEPTLLVLYGDHMPSLNFEEEDLLFKNLFETEYVIWTNYDMERKIRNLESYQLSAYVMERLGMNTGIITKLHQENSQDSDYLGRLEKIQYDMLYGEKASIGDKYDPVSMKMGVDEITIKFVNVDEEIIVKGKNFTESSVVKINGNRQATTFGGRRTLVVDSKGLKPGDIITVDQVSDDGIILSTTSPFKY